MYRFTTVFIKPLLLLLLLWAIGFLWFASLVPEEVEAPDSPTDAIVVLTGGSKRVAAGVDLLKAQKAKRLLISGVDEKVGTKSLERVVSKWPKEMQSFIDLGHAARDTRENSLEAKEWVDKNHFKSLRLVTSSYHMVRSHAEFRHAMPEIEIVDHPVFLHEVRSGGWWYSALTDSAVLGEYHKFVFATIRILCHDMLKKIT